MEYIATFHEKSLGVNLERAVLRGPAFSKSKGGSAVVAGGWLVWWCAWCVSASRASFVNTGFFQRRRGSRCGALHLKLQPPRQGIHQNGASRRLRCICQWFERGCGFTTCVCAPLTPCWFAGHRYLRCRARLSCRVQDDHVCVTPHLGWLPTPGESHQE